LARLEAYGFETGQFNGALSNFIKSSSNKSLTRRHFIRPSNARGSESRGAIVAQIHQCRKIFQAGE
jgi:hypothetical protein